MSEFGKARELKYAPNTLQVFFCFRNGVIPKYVANLGHNTIFVRANWTVLVLHLLLMVMSISYFLIVQEVLA
ncbi:MAG: hypothetical protein BGO33_00135 [Bacteroidia bacterium 43-41]|nr:MAG: hypothetical protein BGO33_00135 [Bacteroidia bacterium 43-41]